MSTPPLIDQTYELVAIARLRPHPDNPNVGDVSAIAESIRTNGWHGTVVIQKSTGLVVAGWHRSQALASLGAAEVPAVWRDIDDVTARRIVAADNETGRRGSYDEQVLARLLSGINDDSPTGLIGTGFGDSDLEDLLAATDLTSYMPTDHELTPVSGPTSAPAPAGELPVEEEQPRTADSPTPPPPPQPDLPTVELEPESKPEAERQAETPDDRRTVVLDLPVEQYEWFVESLEKICDAENVPTQEAAVVLLVSRYVDALVPREDEGLEDDSESDSIPEF